MKKFLLAGLLLTGLALAVPTYAVAKSDGKGCCTQCVAKAEKCKTTKLKAKLKPLWVHQDVIGVSDEQLAQIKTIKHKALKELIQLEADKKIIMVDLKSAVKADVIDTRAANALVDSKYAVKVKTAKTYIKALSDVQQVLSEEQRAAWKSIAGAKASDCKRCPSKGKYCPLTGKPLGDKDS